MPRHAVGEVAGPELRPLPQLAEGGSRSHFRFAALPAALTQPRPDAALPAHPQPPDSSREADPVQRRCHRAWAQPAGSPPAPPWLSLELRGLAVACPAAGLPGRLCPRIRPRVHPCFPPCAVHQSLPSFLSGGLHALSKGAQGPTAEKETEFLIIIGCLPQDVMVAEGNAEM